MLVAMAEEGSLDGGRRDNRCRRRDKSGVSAEAEAEASQGVAVEVEDRHRVISYTHL